jgi:hypothetical protein
VGKITKQYNKTFFHSRQADVKNLTVNLHFQMTNIPKHINQKLWFTLKSQPDMKCFFSHNPHTFTGRIGAWGKLDSNDNFNGRWYQVRLLFKRRPNRLKHRKSFRIGTKKD